MNTSKRIGLMNRLNQAFCDAGLEPPTFKVPGHNKRISSSRIRQLVRLFNQDLLLEKAKKDA